jgi:hypothetical protein
MGRFDRRQNQTEVVETDAAGRFTFIPQDDPDYLVIALHDAGFALVSAAKSWPVAGPFSCSRGEELKAA